MNLELSIVGVDVKREGTRVPMVMVEERRVMETALVSGRVAREKFCLIYCANGSRVVCRWKIRGME